MAIKLFLTFIILNLSISGFTQVPKKELLSNLNIEANQLYLVCRGTKSKSGLISNEFNLSKNNISHVGIGYMKDSLLYVAHISNEKQRGKTGLTIDKAYNYILDSEVYHFSLWKINLTYSEFIKAIKVIDDLKKDSIHFDFDFRLDNGNSLYCSELCVKVLQAINKEKFIFVPTQKRITNPIIQAILKREILEYYPADFFLRNSNFSCLVSYSF